MRAAQERISARTLKELGLTFKMCRQEIAAGLASLPAGRTPTRADWTRLSRGWRHRLDDQIAALTALRDGLDSCIGCGCLSLRRCALSNPADVAADSGPGASYLPWRLRRAEAAPQR